MKNASKSQKGQSSSRSNNESPRGIGSQSELDTDYTDQTSAVGQNEGEGSRTAARRYNKATEDYVRSNDVTSKAREAEQALDGGERDELLEAEQKAKNGPDWGINSKDR
jgi:hypothetical protein